MLDGFKQRISSNGTARTSQYGWKWSNIMHLIMRGIQIIAALVVIGYYASDLNAARKRNRYSDSKWVFAVVVGCMAAISALVLAIVSIFSQYRATALLFAWEWILVILWAAVSGVFGKMYLRERCEMDGGVCAMKTAAGFDLANLILWLITAILATATFFYSPRKSLHTGRANLRG